MKALPLLPADPHRMTAGSAGQHGLAFPAPRRL